MGRGTTGGIIRWVGLGRMTVEVSLVVRGIILGLTLDVSILTGKILSELIRVGDFLILTGSGSTIGLGETRGSFNLEIGTSKDLISIGPTESGESFGDSNVVLIVSQFLDKIKKFLVKKIPNIV